MVEWLRSLRSARQASVDTPLVQRLPPALVPGSSVPFAVSPSTWKIAVTPGTCWKGIHLIRTAFIPRPPNLRAIRLSLLDSQYRPLVSHGEEGLYSLMLRRQAGCNPD